MKGNIRLVNQTAWVISGSLQRVGFWDIYKQCLSGTCKKELIKCRLATGICYVSKGYTVNKRLAFRTNNQINKTSGIRWKYYFSSCFLSHNPFHWSQQQSLSFLILHLYLKPSSTRGEFPPTFVVLVKNEDAGWFTAVTCLTGSALVFRGKHASEFHQVLKDGWFHRTG